MSSFELPKKKEMIWIINKKFQFPFTKKRKKERKEIPTTVKNQSRWYLTLFFWMVNDLDPVFNMSNFIGNLMFVIKPAKMTLLRWVSSRSTSFIEIPAMVCRVILGTRSDGYTIHHAIKRFLQRQGTSQPPPGKRSLLTLPKFTHNHRNQQKDL